MLKNSSKSVIICPIFEQIFLVLNEQFTRLKNLVFSHYSYQIDSKQTKQFVPDQILQIPTIIMKIVKVMPQYGASLQSYQFGSWKCHLHSKGLYYKTYGFVIYYFRNKLVCLFKPVKGTDKKKRQQLITKYVNLL